MKNIHGSHKTCPKKVMSENKDKVDNCDEPPRDILTVTCLHSIDISQQRLLHVRRPITASPPL